MAASHSQEISLNGYSTEQWIALAVRAIEKTGWKITVVNPTGITAYSKTTIWSWGETIHISVNNEQALVKSECLKGQTIDWGKNKKNIQQFNQAFEELKPVFSRVQLTQMFDEIISARSIEEQHKEINASTAQGPGFWSYFVPKKSFFVTPALFYLNVAVYLAMVFSGVNGMLPDNESLLKWGANFRPVTTEGEWWRLITCCFIHIGLFHLLFNMYALMYIGILLEPILGKLRFISAYLLAGIAASVCSLWWYDFTLSAGASGAIFGMYGVFLAMLSTNLIAQEERKSLFLSIGIFVLYNLTSGLHGGVDNAAHIGGLLSGVIMGFMMLPGLQKKNQVLAYGSVILMVVLTVGGSWLVVRSLPNDIGKYEIAMQEFGNLEKTGVSLYQMPETTTNEEILEKIDSETMPSWKKAKKVLLGLKKLDLPSKLKNRVDMLLRYCELRIESCVLLRKTVAENTEAYQGDIEENARQIEGIINALGE